MRGLMLTAAVLACGVAVAQSPLGEPLGGPPGKDAKAQPKSELEKALELALKTHPDLRLAEAKMILARAEVEKARLDLTQKVVLAHHDLQVKKAMFAENTRRLEAIRAARMKAPGSVSLDDFLIAEVTANRHANEVKAAEMALDLLQGKGAAREAVTAAQLSLDLDTIRLSRTGKVLSGKGDGLGEAVAPPMAERVRKALDKKLTLSLDDVELADAMSYLSKLSGLHIKGPAAKGTLTTGDVGEVTFGAALQLIEDTLPGHRFVVREYGLLFVSEDKIPPGAVTLMAFWKGAPKAAAEAPKKEKPDIRGKVTLVEKELFKVDLGGDAGLVLDEVLHVFRLGTSPKYLGRVKVVSVLPKGGVVQPVGKMTAPVAVGDVVARRVLGGE